MTAVWAAALLATLAPTARLMWLHDHAGAHRLRRDRRVTVRTWGHR